MERKDNEAQTVEALRVVKDMQADFTRLADEMHRLKHELRQLREEMARDRVARDPYIPVQPWKITVEDGRTPHPTKIWC